MPGVFRPYTAADIIGSLQDSIASVASTSSSSSSQIGFFAEDDETVTLGDAATATVLDGDPDWNAGQWGSLAWN